MALILAGCDEQILHNLSEQEANKIVSHLSDDNLRVDKVLQADGRWAISVARVEVMPALRRLENQRLLPPREVVASTSGRSSIVPSREEQWFQYERSVSLAIEESIKALPGVLDARVHVNLPDRDPLFGSRRSEKGSGSVLLVVGEGFASADQDIAALVGGAAGLSRDVVGILRSAPERLHGSGDDTQVSGSTGREGVLERAVMKWPLAICVVALLASACAVMWGVKMRRIQPLFPLPKNLDFEG